MQLCKKNLWLWHLVIWQNLCFGQSYYSKIEKYTLSFWDISRDPGFSIFILTHKFWALFLSGTCKMRNIFKLHVREIRVNQGVGVNATNPYAKKWMDRQMPNKMFFSCRFCINYCRFLEIKKEKNVWLNVHTEDIEAIVTTGAP